MIVYIMFYCTIYHISLTELCHAKRSIKSLVVVILKEGWCARAPPPSFYAMPCHTKRRIGTSTKRRMRMATHSHPSFGMTMTKALGIL